MTPEDERELTRRLRATLDRAAAEADPALEHRVQAALRAARPPASRRGPWAFAGMALAAGVAAIVWMPLREPAPAPVSPVMAQAALTPAVEPEFLDDLELLAAVGEDPDES